MVLKFLVFLHQLLILNWVNTSETFTIHFFIKVSLMLCFLSLLYSLALSYFRFLAIYDSAVELLFEKCFNALFVNGINVHKKESISNETLFYSFI